MVRAITSSNIDASSVAALSYCVFFAEVAITTVDWFARLSLTARLVRRRSTFSQACCWPVANSITLSRKLINYVHDLANQSAS